MRKDSIEHIYKLAKEDCRVVFIGSDLGAGSIAKYQTELPKQFLMEGISEAHIVSMAAGLALTGCKVFIHTIAPFFVRRALEQIILDIGAENLDVCILCSGGGLVYGPLGHSHTMVDDFSILSTVPNLKLYAPADALEMIKILNEINSSQGPSYIRMGKGNEKPVTHEFQYSLTSGNFIQGKNHSDNLIITTGIMLQRCLDIQRKIEKLNILHIPQIDSIYSSDCINILKNHKNIFIIEEHLRTGGIYSRVSDVMISEIIMGLNIKHYSLGNDYIFQYGKQEQLHEILKLDFDSLLHNIKECIK
ncbi:transketolase family protein [Bacteriovorax sp. Seq25_V]|uniref:transketolase family protein n=1 Tax=Bacteriovorax sp. Seq25_V TaxID=1201288 RepID=UPI00038A0F66|nr:transketolase C-terminal domain-containing protein [Bacteriovorax sp. Seq25_V]EQC46810.1 transketolase, pyridine binding domain protein [Bacteriovorax sp. Seq25_V]